MGRFPGACSGVRHGGFRVSQIGGVGPAATSPAPHDFFSFSLVFRVHAPGTVFSRREKREKPEGTAECLLPTLYNRLQLKTGNHWERHPPQKTRTKSQLYFAYTNVGRVAVQPTLFGAERFTQCAVQGSVLYVRV